MAIVDKEKSFNYKNNFTEWEMVEKSIPFFEFKGYKVYCEVPIMGTSADIVLKKDNTLYGIEAKIKDKKRVLQQCKERFSMTVDYIGILWGSKITEPLIRECKIRGYGLIHYLHDKKTIETILKPRYNYDVWKPQQNILYLKMREMEIHDERFNWKNRSYIR